MACYVRLHEPSILSCPQAPAGHGALRTGGCDSLFPNSRSRSNASGGAAAARSPTPAAASRPRRGSPSTTAGRAWTNCRRSRPRSTLDTSRKVITRNDSPDIGFDRSINPYRGCEHGCVYCFARPTHAYLGLSPGLDFESKLLCQARRAGAAGEGTGGAGLRAAHDRDRHQHRSLSADRARAQNHARHSRSAGARRPSRRHRHQIGAGRRATSIFSRGWPSAISPRSRFR